MDRQTLKALLMVLVVFYVWQGYKVANQEPELESPAIEMVETSSSEQPLKTRPPERLASSQHNDHLPVERRPFKGCGIDAEWTTDGAYLQNLSLTKYQAATQVTPIWTWALSGFSGAWVPYGKSSKVERLGTSNGAYLGAGVGVFGPALQSKIVDENTSRLHFQSEGSQGIRVDKEVMLTGEPCVIDMTITWKNTSSVDFSDGLWVNIHDVLPEESGYFVNSLRPVSLVDGGIETVGDLDDISEPQALEGVVGWFGLADRYFAALAVPDPGSKGHLIHSSFSNNGVMVYGSEYRLSETLKAGQSHSEHFRMYVGPKDSTLMSAVDPALTELIKHEFGWFAVVAYPLLALLKFIHSLVGNWGLAIIALTVSIKTVLFPLTQISFKSTQAMQAIQPALQAVREEYKDDPEELNRRTIALFQENGVNPLGGCLPMIIQMPVWFALYRVLLNSVELYHTDFLYLKDLSAVDPYGALPAVVVIMMLVQQSMMPSGNMDPAQAKMMKLMPLMFGLFFFTFPSGLVVYIFVNTLLTILQQWLIKRQFNTDKKPVLA